MSKLRRRRSLDKYALTVCCGTGSAVQTEESGHSGARGKPTTGLASTADAVNQKVDVAFGRTTVTQGDTRDGLLYGLAASDVTKINRHG